MLRKILILSILLFSCSPLFAQEKMPSDRVLTLSEAINIALKSNPAVQVALEKISSSRFNISEARTGRLPRFNLDTSVTKHKDTFSDLWQFPESITIPTLYGSVNVLGVDFPVTVPPFQLPLPQPSNIALSSTTNYSTRISYKQSLYSGGRIDYLVSQTRLGEKLAKLESENTKQEVTINVVRAYYGVLKAKQLLWVTKEALNHSKETLKIAKVKLTAGKVPEFEVIHTKAELASMQQNLISAETAYEIAKISFLSLLDLEPSTYFELQDENLPIFEQTANIETQTSDFKLLSSNPKNKEFDYQPSTFNLSSMINYAYEHRPEMQQLQISKQIAGVGVRLAKSNLKPNIGIGASYDWTGQEFPGDIKSWNITLAASMPLFDSGETRWKVASARSNLKQVEGQEQTLKKQIALEVTQSYLKLRECEQRIKTIQISLEEAKQASSIAHVRYRANLASNLEVKDSQLLYLQAKTTYIQSIYDYKIAQAELDKALGR